MLVRLLYASRASSPLVESALASIMDQSRRNNPRHGITGVLCHGGDVFLQVIEGGRDAICRLFRSLVTDPRHDSVQILLYEEIAERGFAGWSMGEINIAKASPALLLKYSEMPRLDPFNCSGRASLALLSDLIASASFVNRGE